MFVSSLSPAARAELGTLIAALGGEPAGECANAAALADALAASCASGGPAEPPSEQLVITGFEWRDAAAFVATARACWAPAVMLVGPDAATGSAQRATLEMHPAVEAGAAAVLRFDISPARLRAALEAVRAQLRVFDTRSTVDAGVAGPAPGPSGRALTPREHEILGLLAAGASNKRIARELGVSANTVKFHLGALFRKLAVTSRAEAVGVALRRGTLTL